MKYVIGRLREASTWKGILAMLTAFGVAVRPDHGEAIATLGAAVFGAAAVMLPDKFGGEK